MVQKTFEATEVVLGKVFNDDYLFQMPVYQRPYSWTTEETSELLSDLANAMNDETSADPYFLGSIVLISDPNNSKHEVIDGQQRLTTLTMLFCVLRDLSECQTARDSLNLRVMEKQDIFAGGRNRFRLSIRDRDMEFFQDKVQNEGKIQDFISEGETPLSTDSRKLIFRNTKYLWERLSTWSPEKRDSLSEFVIRKCYLVIISAYDRDSAHRIFAVLNARGRDLTPTDILKSDVIGEIPGRKQPEYTQRWEDIEDELGREEFRELFTHIYVIFKGDRFHRELAKAFNVDVLSVHNGIEFIDDILVRYTEAFKVIRKSVYENSEYSNRVNRMLEYLGRIDNDDWIPIAMVFYDRYKDEPAKFLRLLKDLDRLAYAMFILGIRRDARLARYAPAISAVKNNDENIFGDSGPLQLTQQEQMDVVSVLNQSIYRLRPVGRFARPLLLRLDSMLADADAHYNPKTVTVEHVLPQTPDNKSDWVRNFPDEDERIEWTHKLANLVLLSRSKNSKAQNYEFNKKKTEYFQRNGVTPFALTTQIVSESEWTPKVLARRQDKLISVIKSKWRLS